MDSLYTSLANDFSMKLGVSEKPRQSYRHTFVEETPILTLVASVNANIATIWRHGMHKGTILCPQGSLSSELLPQPTPRAPAVHGLPEATLPVPPPCHGFIKTHPLFQQGAPKLDTFHGLGPNHPSIRERVFRLSYQGKFFFHATKGKIGCVVFGLPARTQKCKPMQDVDLRASLPIQ